MRIKLIATALLTVVTLSAVWAQSGPTATVSWLAPSTYVDTTPISAGELDHYTLTWTSTVSGGPSGTMSLPGSSLSVIVPFACGSATFSLSVTTTTSAKYPGATSGASSPVVYDSKVACAPNPPSGLGVQSSGTSSK